MLFGSKRRRERQEDMREDTRGAAKIWGGEASYLNFDEIYTMWKVRNYPATLILHEINFGLNCFFNNF